MKLRITDQILESIGATHRLCAVISRRDADLARQIRRAVNSLGLNASEGLSAAGGNRTVRLESAMASGREAVFGLRIAGVTGYIASDEAQRHATDLDRIVGGLYKLA